MDLALVGGGMLMGERVGYSILVGSVIAYAIIAKIAEEKGWVKDSSNVMDMRNGARGLLLWPGVTFMAQVFTQGCPSVPVVFENHSLFGPVGSVWVSGEVVSGTEVSVVGVPGGTAVVSWVSLHAAHTAKRAKAGRKGSAST